MDEFEKALEKELEPKEIQSPEAKMISKVFHEKSFTDGARWAKEWFYTHKTYGVLEDVKRLRNESATRKAAHTELLKQAMGLRDELKASLGFAWKDKTYESDTEGLMQRMQTVKSLANFDKYIKEQE